MKTHRKSLVIAVATALGTLSALPAQALQSTTGPVSFANSANVTDDEGGSSTSISNASLGSSSLSQFDPALGVLTGTALNLISNRTQTTQVTSTDGSGKNGSLVTSKGEGSSNASISTPGINHTFSTISNADQCIGLSKNSCTGIASLDLVTITNLTAPTSSLDDYVGNSTVTATRIAPSLTATQTSNVFTGVESTKYTLLWAGILSLTYDYLLHAAPSFDGSSSMLTLDLDFGTVFLGDIVPDLDFSLYNPAGERVGLDLDNFNGSGDTAKLTTNLSAFSVLTAGLSQNFLASFNTSNLGVYSASYTLNLSDANVGAASSRFNYVLTLNLTGSVVERIPEPGILSLLGIGLLGLPFARRRRS